MKRYPGVPLFAALLCSMAASSSLAQASACGLQTAKPLEERVSNTARWISKSEVQSAYFDVYRSESPDGPFEQINPKPISAAGLSAAAKTYEYQDSEIDPCRDYFYYIEAVSAADGSAHRISEVMRAKAKRSADGDAD